MKFRVTASAWNRMVDYVFRHRLASMLSLAGDSWRHPWFTTAEWNATDERWEASVRAGYVNEQDVTVKVVNADKEKVSVPLSDSPSFVIGSTRSIASNVPSLFQILGVRSANSISEELLDLGITEIDSGPPSDSSQERKLKACDIILRCTRPTTAVDWTFGTIVDSSFAQFKVGFKGSSVSQFSLYSTASYVPVAQADDIDRLAGIANDVGYDERRVATIYFLSPPGVGSDYELDNTWEPFVQHELFWNADYIVRLPPSAAQAQPLQINLAGLGSSAGAQINVNQLLATNNDAFEAAKQFLYSNQVTGRITTPGHTKPPDWDHDFSLDPPFPYKGLP